MFVKTHDDVLVNLSQFSSIVLCHERGDRYVIRAFKQDRHRPSLENIDIIEPTDLKKASEAFVKLVQALNENGGIVWNADNTKIGTNPFSV